MFLKGVVMDEYGKRFCAFMKSYSERQEMQKWGSLTRLANFLGISQSQMSNIIAGRKAGSEEFRRKVADKIGVSYEEIVGTQDDEKLSVGEDQPFYKTEEEVLLEKAEKILQSDCEFKSALKTNIESLYRSFIDRRQAVDKKELIPKSGDRRK